MDQKKFEKAIFNMLEGFQDMSNCSGSHVAACLIDGNRIVSQGWNGTPAGTINCNDVFKKDGENWIIPLTSEFKAWLDEYISRYDVTVTEYYKSLVNQKDAVSVTVTDKLKGFLHGKWSEKYEIHAEMNMLFNMMKQQANIDDLSKCTVYITHSPCAQCMKNLAGLGLKNIKYKELYWRDSKQNLENSAQLFGINISQYNA